MTNMETTEEVEVQRVSFDMPVELHRRLKLVAVKEDMTLKHILNGLVENWVTKKEEANG